MARLFKILLRVFAGLAAVVAIVVMLVYYLAGQSLPDYDRTLEVTGVQGQVQIIRDNHAIPHIFSEFERDVYFGLGYAHAEDRLWQMLIQRRRVQGRLSEVFGEATLDIDILMRTLNLYGISQASVEYQTPETKAILQAYSDGVNARLKAIADLALGRGAPELFLFDPKIAPWTPTDSLALMRQMALTLTDKAAVESLQAELRLILPAERVDDLFPEQQGEARLALPDFAFDVVPADRPRPVRHALYPLPRAGFAGASNAWAVSPNRSASGGALLANDPHMNFSAPSAWMLARMEFPEGGVIGGTLPGIPAIVTGRNSRFGWGVTASYLDDQDLYYERLNPENPEEYQTPDGFEPFERRDVIIDILDQPAMTVEIRQTRHGPVIEGNHWDIDQITPSGHKVALSWTGFDPTDQSIDALLGLMRASSIDQGRSAVARATIPPLTVTMATRQEIALQAAGRAPQRGSDHMSQGRFPAPGWLARNDWAGYTPFDSNPYMRNPSSGVVVNTNNRLTDKDFPDHWSFDWGDDQRILRAERMLNGREFHTLDSFIEMQTDTVSPSARTLLPLIARDLWFSGEPAASGTVERMRQRALELLADWNGEMSEHDAEPLIYAAWVRALQRRLILDELGGELTARMTELRPLFIERVFRDFNGAGVWCDVNQTSRTETCAETARVALDQALLDLSEKFGDKIESWRWGSVHQAHHKHDVLGNIPFLSWFVNIKQDTPGGDNTMLRGLTAGSGEEPFLNIHGAGYRMALDFADPEASVFIISTGQSGHFLSRHYDDLSQIWRRSEYIPMTLDPILARGGNVGVTLLVPAVPK